ncbi:tRNA (adenosine(37)-N6)-threonylcarbamoyltransferase complex dimerization subunit type 1 TsaB [Larkinella soli]|uniref:tRNA (adenosine(37)-N6)-threonylcarbamoyltransferase complex dimerization subunit type 1 TsaB n=1 Tax=Larkinella soli TaxID=1770527 RepID=UPI000FFBA564|nr:tRNA (adenosine(37)-N6)-threonylcarbamoyltransferase complex dimerization subunit type 1 TsaB [Larkinella soli]
MPLILSIDTSTTVCSVALHQGDGLQTVRLLSCYELFAEKSSSGMLTTLIRDAVRQAGHQLTELDAVAVAKGPGSYTGLRIGVSTAKGLCFALDKPLLAVNTLEAMAEQVRPFYESGTAESPALCPMIDARRMEVYCAAYDPEGAELMPTTALVVDETSFPDLLSRGPVVFFGNGAAKCRAVLAHQPNAVFIDEVIHPSARTVGRRAAAAFEAGRFEDVAAFEPFYLKDFQGTKPKKLVV